MVVINSKELLPCLIKEQGSCRHVAADDEEVIFRRPSDVMDGPFKVSYCLLLFSSKIEVDEVVHAVVALISLIVK